MTKTDEGSADTGLVRVATWNIERAQNISRVARELDVLPELAQVDILLLQEMTLSATRNLAMKAGMNFEYYSGNSDNDGPPCGNAVMSRWPMFQRTVATSLPGMVPPFVGRQRSLVGATVAVRGLTLDAVSTHTETVMMPLSSRLAQLRFAASSLALSERTKLVLAGDFNTASNRSACRFDEVLAGVGLTRASRQGLETFRRFGRAFALDRIYVRDGSAEASGVVEDATASDHLPVWCDLRF